MAITNTITITDVSVTPLSGFVSNNNSFTIEWDHVTTQTNELSGYFEVHRFIGDYPADQSANPETDSYTIINTTSSLNVNSYDDTLAGIDEDIVSDILYTKRKLFYYVQGYVKTSTNSYEYSDAFPFVAISNNAVTICPLGYKINGSLRSTKQQVKNNVLYNEGEVVWAGNYSTLGAVEFSRTSIDVNDTRPGGNGSGTVWYCDRRTHKVVRSNLLTGEVERVYTIDTGGDVSNALDPNASANGNRSIAIDPFTGDAFMGGYFNTKMYLLPHDLTEPVKEIGSCRTNSSYGIVYNNGFIYENRPWSTPHSLVKWSLVRGSNNSVTAAIPSYATFITDAYGIAAGSDNRVWINAHRGVLYRAFDASESGYFLDYELAANTYGACKGLCTDIPSENADSKYNIYCAAHGYNGIYKIPWDYNGGGLGTAVKIPMSHVTGVGADSENNIWGVGAGNIFKYYNEKLLINDTDFPSGGNCRYPTTSFDLWYETNSNVREIDYFLTRDPTQMPPSAANAWYALTASNVTEQSPRTYGGTTYYLNTYGIKVAGTTLSDQTLSASNWIATYASNIDDININCPGRVLFPNYGNKINNVVQFDRIFNGSYQYSDFTGAQSVDTTVTDVIVTNNSNIIAVHPDYIEPTISINLGDSVSIPNGEDGNYWTNQINVSGNNISGYDDLSVECNIEDNDPTFDVVYNYNFNDRLIDIGGDINTYIFQYSLQPSQTYLYNDPSQSGKPGERYNGYPGEILGYYALSASISGNVNAYKLPSDGPGYDQPVVVSVSGMVTVWERWPTAEFEPIPVDGLSQRQSLWSRSHGLPVGTISDGVVSGYDPLYVKFNDLSVARTWPLSAWTYDFGNGNGTYTGGLETSAVIYAPNDLYSPRDSVTTHNDITNHVFYQPGTYYTTMYTTASTTGTESADLTTLNRDVTATIIVLETPPLADFLTPLVSTVSASYSDDIDTPIVNHLYDSTPPVYVSTTFISGYSPNLTITWQDSSQATSYPISSYVWDFDDWYNETHSLSTINASQVIVGYPNWVTDITTHTVEHTYVMPGLYNMTLTTEASTTGTQSVCSVEVYVEEIPPTGGNIESSVNNDVTGGYDFSFSTTPLSTYPDVIYFRLSSVIPGSFPIGRIEWDFGDGSDIYIVSRNTFTDTIIGPTAYPNDLNDPRNVIVSNEYTELGTYTIGASAFSSNTNTMIEFEHTLGPLVERTWENSRLKITGNKHLISSRNIDGTKILVFEDETTHNIYNVALSG
jgi:hypothetical protein